MSKEGSTKHTVITTILGIIITVLGGIMVYHYQKADTIKAENKMLQQQLSQQREKDSLNVLKFRGHLETLIGSCNRRIANSYYQEAKEIAADIRWTFNDSVELKIEYEKKRNELLFLINKKQQHYQLRIDTGNHYIPYTINTDNSFEFKLTEKGGEQVEPNTRFSFFCTYASDERQTAKIIIQFPNSHTNRGFEFTGQGSTFEFDVDNIRHRITLLKVNDGGALDVPAFKIKRLL